MQNEKLIHDWMVSYLKDRLSRDYNEIKANPGEEKDNEFNGHYPDLILGNHGLVLAVMEVETENSITSEKAEEWKTRMGSPMHMTKIYPSSPGGPLGSSGGVGGVPPSIGGVPPG